MSGNRLLRSNASVSPNEDAVITTIGPGKGDDELKRWFWDDNGAAGVEEVDITRDEKVAAGIAGYSGDKLRIYRVLYDPMTAPAQKLGPFENNPDVVEPCIEAGQPVGGKFDNLSFSPDGRNLAYSVATASGSSTCRTSAAAAARCRRPTSSSSPAASTRTGAPPTSRRRRPTRRSRSSSQDRLRSRRRSSPSRSSCRRRPGGRRRAR
jgi:hypothetical protein